MSDIEISNNVNDSAVSQEEVAAAAKSMMTNLLKLMGVNVELTMSEREGLPLVSLRGEDESILIGRHGETLQSLHVLLSLMLQKKFRGAAMEVLVDVDDYLERRRDSLTQMAIKMANRAIDNHCSVSLKPMSPQERRVVHMALKEYPGVSTQSSGEGEERYITIIPDEQ